MTTQDPTPIQRQSTPGSTARGHKVVATKVLLDNIGRARCMIYTATSMVVFVGHPVARPGGTDHRRGNHSTFA